MDRDAAVLAHDLAILEEMAAEIDAYLASDTLDWTIPRANMPKLTIGGYLMRQQRLLALQDLMSKAERQRLHNAIAQYDQALKEKVVRFETRAHQELHARIADWMRFLRDLNNRIKMEKNYYAGVVDTRVVIEVLLDNLKQPPYRLSPDIVPEVLALDRKLRGQLADHDFIWDVVWEKAYAPEQYWYLYGCPVSVTAARA